MQILPDFTSIVITWKEDIVHGYELQYSYNIRGCPESNSDIMKISIDDGKINSYTLHKVEEDSDFTISLVAINPAGRSIAATEMVTTLQAGIY